jgi:hypothetical protein
MIPARCLPIDRLGENDSRAAFDLQQRLPRRSSSAKLGTTKNRAAEVAALFADSVAVPAV